MDIQVVVFHEPILMGKSMVPERTLTQGQRFDRCVLKLEYFNDLFLKITFKHTNPALDYCQNVPWARVDNCIYKDTPIADLNPETNPRGKRAAK